MSLHDFFATHPVFRTDELAAYQGKRSRWTRKNLLAHHRKQGRILPVQKGLYAVVPRGQDPATYTVDPYLIAAKMTDDSVLAYHSALELRGRSHSAFQEFYFLSRRPPRPRVFRSYRFRGILFPKALRAAGKDKTQTKVVDRAGVAITVTTFERTLVDLHDRPELGGGWEEIWRSLETVEYFDLGAVVDYATLLGNRTTAAKVGYYLQQHAETLMVEEQHLGPLRKLRPRQPHYMERAKSGKLVSDWNLIVPRSLAERSWEEPA